MTVQLMGLDVESKGWYSEGMNVLKLPRGNGYVNC